MLFKQAWKSNTQKRSRYMMGLRERGDVRK